MVNFKKARERMVETQIAARGIHDEGVLEAMRKVPRHLFVDEALRDQAYSDHPLPIAENQTISQPYIVALMTESLELNGAEKVLELGTGSGYQTAILAELADRVFSSNAIRSLRIAQMPYSRSWDIRISLSGSETVRLAGRTTRPSMVLSLRRALLKFRSRS